MILLAHQRALEAQLLAEEQRQMAAAAAATLKPMDSAEYSRKRYRVECSDSE